MKISTVTAQTKRGNRWPVCAEASNRQGEHVARPCFRPHFPCGPVPAVPVVVVYTSLAATCHKSTSISRGATWPSHFLFPNPSPPPRVFQQLPTLLCVIFTAS